MPDLNTLQDLRATLDQHAHDVHDDASVSRVAAVAGRAGQVRRRRAGAVVAAAAVVAAGVVTAPMLADPTPPRGPRWLAGHEAPATLTSLGFTYRFADGVENGASARASVRLPRSDAPRLVTWAADATQVTVDSPYDRDRSTYTGFDDFAVVRPGESGRWSVRAGGADAALAVYELSETAPGVQVAGLTFREQVGSDRLVDVAVGELDDVDVSLRLTLPEGRLRVVEYCTGVAAEDRLWVNTGFAGNGTTASGDCSDDGYDPGAEGSSAWFEPGQLGQPGETVTLRTWVSTKLDGPVVEKPGVRLGIAVYEEAEPAAVVAGWDMPQLYEHDGHVWRFVGTETGATGQGELEVRNDGDAELLVVGSYNGTGKGRVAFRSAPGEGVDRSSAGGGGSDLRAVLHPGGPAARLRVQGDVAATTRLGFALYERVD